MKARVIVFFASIASTLAMPQAGSQNPEQHLQASSTSPTDLQLSTLFLTIHTIAYKFYNYSFTSFRPADFARASYQDWVWSRFKEIEGDARTHGEFWRSAVTSTGQGVPQEMVDSDFRFNSQDVHSFLDRSLALENAATSCYLGSVAGFEDKGYLTVASSILAETAKHSAWINSAVKKGAPWNGPFETSITPSQCLTLLSSILTNAPAILTQSYLARLPPNTKIHPPVQVGPKLVPGQETDVIFDDSTIRSNPDTEKRLYGTFLNGAEMIFARVDVIHSQAPSTTRYKVRVPQNLQGACIFYLSLVPRSSGNEAEDLASLRSNPDETIVAGPTMMLFDFGPGRGRAAVNGGAE